jgi:phosphoserine phosphatase RsbU/P
MPTVRDDGMADTISSLAGARVLIADDQPDVLDALRLLLKTEGCEIESAGSPEGILEALGRRQFDVLLMDMNYARDTTSGQEGLDLVARIQALDSSLPIVVMTAWSTVNLAVESMRRGVRDFVQKPWENQHVLDTLSEQVRRVRADRSEKQREDQEREDARQVGRGLLPRELPEVPGYDLSVFWQPASVVGGDYFDARLLGEARLALAIGDVVGKGVPAALLMSNLQAAVKAFAAEGLSPADLCARVNHVMHGNLTSERFITFFFAVLDASSGRLLYSNAGHNAPILARRDGSCAHLDCGGPVLGILGESAYQLGEISLGPGDVLALFTDGLTEARDERGEEFGEAGLLQSLAAHRELATKALQRKVVESVSAFCHGKFEDDATLVVLKATE